MPRAPRDRAILFASATTIYASAGVGLIYAGNSLLGYLCLAVAAVEFVVLCLVPFFSAGDQTFLSG